MQTRAPGAARRNPDPKDAVADGDLGDVSRLAAEDARVPDARLRARLVARVAQLRSAWCASPARAERRAVAGSSALFGMNVSARSASTQIVSVGMTPRLAEIAEPSITYKPS